MAEQFSRREFIKAASAASFFTIDEDNDGEWLDDLLGWGDNSSMSVYVGNETEVGTLDAPGPALFFAIDTNEWYKKSATSDSFTKFDFGGKWTEDQRGRLTPEEGAPLAVSRTYLGSRNSAPTDDDYESGEVAIYSRNGTLYERPHGGTESELGSGGGDIASDDVGRIDVQPTQPDNPTEGDIWIQTN